MATPKCPNCISYSFEINPVTPSGSKFSVLMVNCSECGCVVTSMDNVYLPAAIQFLKDDIAKIAKAMNVKL
jgi:hypothetical protein